jgi:hypothetical protein
MGMVVVRSDKGGKRERNGTDEEVMRERLTE